MNERLQWANGEIERLWDALETANDQIAEIGAAKEAWRGVYVVAMMDHFIKEGMKIEQASIHAEARAAEVEAHIARQWKENGPA